MKRSFLLYLPIFAIIGCAQQQPAPSAAATGPITPTSYAAGSAGNTTTAFDGTWTGGPVVNMSAGSALPGGGEGSSRCPHYDAPPLTISNGLAQFDVQNIRFQGYVTPQGALAMRTGVGQRFEGQIDAQNILRGRVIGACVYDATWQKSAYR
jgi:hypothetical protein